jgi:hypothetical protein
VLANLEVPKIVPHRGALLTQKSLEDPMPILRAHSLQAVRQSWWAVCIAYPLVHARLVMMRS